MNASQLRIEITVDKDWIALNVYRMTLERIAKAVEDEPWSDQEAGDLARQILREFPGSAEK